MTTSNERTDERTHVTPNNDCAILEVSDVRARVQEINDSVASFADVIAAGIFPTGERFPVVRTGEREPIPYQLRSAVWLRDKGICQKCGVRNPKPWQLDHIVPWSAGGTDDSTNLRVLCEPCNQNRSNYDDATTFARRPVTWWCHRCYSDPEWTFYGLSSKGGVYCRRHLRSRHACSLERVTKWQEEAGEDFRWFFRQEPIEEVGRPVFCAHCNVPSVSEVAL